MKKKLTKKQKKERQESTIYECLLKGLKNAIRMQEWDIWKIWAMTVEHQLDMADVAMRIFKLKLKHHASKKPR